MKVKSGKRFWPVVITVALVLTVVVAQGSEQLPSFNVDVRQTSVSGLSSGGFMAVQFDVAFSDTLVGAGVVAGGPYDCAQGTLAKSFFPCMFGSPDVAPLVKQAKTWARKGAIDPLAGLARQKIYIFTGKSDHTVVKPVVEATRQFYRKVGVSASNIKFVDTIDAGHAMVTTDFGNPCPVTESPFINKCDFDLAGEILMHIYGPLKPPSATLSGKVIAFDQNEFVKKESVPSVSALALPTMAMPIPSTAPISNTHSMSDTGFVYVPAACASRQQCRVHLVFHGCKQTTSDIGDKYYADTGYNRWADANNIIVLYPQIAESLLNPNGCWDWFSYDSADYAVKTGPQMAAVKAMLDRIAGR